MDFERITSLPEFGFYGGVRIGNLQNSCDGISNEQGVYLIVRRGKQSVSFLETSAGGWFKNRDPSVSVAKLRDRWLPRPSVLYIGKAGGAAVQATIHDRLNSFMRFGLGSRSPHWGGRYIWQLAAAKELLVYWKPTPGQEPRQVERDLLLAFRAKYGQLPFANLKN